MASNGLENKAIRGQCRMCFRVRCTSKHVHAVGERRHGFATGYIWECVDESDCDAAIARKLAKHVAGSKIHEFIKCAVANGRMRTYTIYR